jgi:ubiquitin C-terminal hydrolase
MPPAKSQSKSKISKDKKESSPKPRRSKTSDDDKTRVDYYKKFPDNKRGEAAAVDIGANAGLKNSNVVCYSNAILQCICKLFLFI